MVWNLSQVLRFSKDGADCLKLFENLFLSSGNYSKEG